MSYVSDIFYIVVKITSFLVSEQIISAEIVGFATTDKLHEISYRKDIIVDNVKITYGLVPVRDILFDGDRVIAIHRNYTFVETRYNIKANLHLKLKTAWNIFQRYNK